MCETEEQRAERLADILSDRDWVLCDECAGYGYVDELQGEPPHRGIIRIECPECDGQGGWPADEASDEPGRA